MLLVNSTSQHPYGKKSKKRLLFFFAGVTTVLSKTTTATLCPNLQSHPIPGGAQGQSGWGRE